MPPHKRTSTTLDSSSLKETDMTDNLFGDATFEAPARVRPTRVKVDVPPTVLKLLNDAAVTRQRITWPVKDAAHYESMADVLYSAGDHLPGNSILCRPMIRTEGEDDITKDVKPEHATHILVTVGARRGRRPAE